jgi:hypothetical protein
MMRSRVVAVGVAIGAAIALAGCTAMPLAPSSPGPTAAAAHSAPAAPKATPGVFNGTLAYQTAWHVAVTSTYVTGAADVCDLNLGISIEDAAALANPDTTVPVYGFVMQHSGDVSYGTVWPTAVAGTGIVDGTATVVVSYDASGLPSTGTGTADLTWHDAGQTPVRSHRSDTIDMTFTPESRAQFCQ